MRLSMPWVFRFVVLGPVCAEDMQSRVQGLECKLLLVIYASKKKRGHLLCRYCHDSRNALFLLKACGRFEAQGLRFEVVRRLRRRAQGLGLGFMT